MTALGAAITILCSIRGHFMEQIISKVGSGQNIELVQYRSGKTHSLGSMTPENCVYLARGMLSCAAAVCDDNRPPVGTVISDSHIPVTRWIVKTFGESELDLIVTVRPGIDLTFRMPTDQKS